MKAQTFKGSIELLKVWIFPEVLIPVKVPKDLRKLVSPTTPTEIKIIKNQDDAM